MSLVAHCYSRREQSNFDDEFTVTVNNTSEFSSLTIELLQYYPKYLNNNNNTHVVEWSGRGDGIEISYYDPIYNCNIRIIDDDSLNECIQSSIKDICVKDSLINDNIQQSILLNTSFNAMTNRNHHSVGLEMSFLSGSDSMLNSMTSSTFSGGETSEFDELSKLYESVEIVDKEGNGLVYRAGPKALKVIPTYTGNQDIESVMKGIFIANMVETEEQSNVDELMMSIFKRIVKVTNVFLLNNGNICVESEWMDIDMLSFVKSGKQFDPYYFLKIMLTTLHLLDKKKVVHRNIKPSIIFHSAGSFQLAGFEYAKRHDQLEREPFKMEGNLNFQAPEIIEQTYKPGKERWNNFRSPYSISSDIFSLGVTLYQLLTLDWYSQWPVLSTELADNIEPFLKQKITNPEHLNIIPLLARMLHRKRKDRVSLYVARCWINKCISLDPIHNHFDLAISDDDLENYSESSDDLMERVDRFLNSSTNINWDEIEFDDSSDAI